MSSPMEANLPRSQMTNQTVWIKSRKGRNQVDTSLQASANYFDADEPVLAQSTSKAPIAKLPTSSSNNPTAGSTDNVANPDRVLIIVEVSGENTEARGFRIKREHTIYTILKGASKSFGVDLARLVCTSRTQRVLIHKRNFQSFP